MKEKELRNTSTCAVCGKSIGHTGIPMFWRVRLERYMLDMKALQRQQGLAMMLGGSGLLAQVMGPDDDLANKITSVEITVCENCAMRQSSVFELVELGHDEFEPEEKSLNG